MKYVLRVLGIAFSLVLAIVIGVPLVAILIFVVFYDWNDARPLLERGASAAIGRTVSIGGDLDVDLDRVTRVRVGDLAIANADWGEADTLLTMGRFELAIALPPLLSGDVVIPLVHASKVRAALERQPDGGGNWTFGEAQSETPDPNPNSAPMTLPIVGDVAIDDAVITFDDRRLDKQFELVLNTLTVAQDQARQELVIDGEGMYQGRPARLDGSMGSPAQLMGETKPYPVDLGLVAGDLRVHVAGTLGAPQQLEQLNLELDMSGDDLSNLIPLTGIAIPPSPPYRLIGRIEREGARWAFTDFSGVLGSSDMQGTVAVDLGGTRPRIEGDVVSRRLDLKDLGSFIGAREGGAAGASEVDDGDGRLLPDKSVDLTQLRSIDANISFKGTQVVTPKVPIDRLNAKVSLEEGTFRAQPVTFAIGEGALRVFFSLYGGQTPVRSDIEVYIENLGLARLLRDIGNAQDMAGTFNGRAKLSATGTSIAEIAGSSSGDLMVVLSGGRFSGLLIELLGLDIAEALGVVIQGDRSVPIRCIVADFDADQGLFTTKTLVFDTTDTNTVGHGSIDMRNESLDLRLQPYPKDFSPLTLRTPISIQGTLQEPDAFPDPADIGVEGGLKKALNAVLTVITGLLPPVDFGPGEDAPCADLIRAARQNVEGGESGRR